MTTLAVLYAAAMMVLLVFGLNQLWLAYRYAWADGLRAGPVPEYDALPASTGEAAWPVLTVQLPLYNERYVAARLIDACVRLDYPAGRLELQVLDDSTDETCAVVAERVAHWQRRGVDIVHVCRDDRAGYKAGALANGLGFARGDLVAVFDADFVPPADFLLRTVPYFADSGIGLVQARWSHLNAGSVLTVAQSALLDAHFVIEQGVRNETACFMNFNGTAGVWRRACIDDAGGWQADTLTEDLDLSYRAQLAGWRFRFVGDLGVPAELPASVAAWRQQQFRWTKGTAETARKMLGRLWQTPPGRTPLPLRVKLEGTLHLTGFVVFPAILLAAVLHAPLLTAHALGAGISDAYLGVMGFGLFAFAGMTLAHLFAQRALYADWPRRMLLFPWFLTASMGLALSNTKGAAEALLRRRSPFVRTPKLSASASVLPWGKDYGSPERSWLSWLEVGLALYCAAGLVALIVSGEWAAAPFQLMFTVGFGFVCVHDPVQQRRAFAKGRTLQPSDDSLAPSARQVPPTRA